MISLEDVRSKIENAEKTLTASFNMLLDFRKGIGNLGNIILNFQPMLAECLFELMNSYKVLQSAKNELISKKSTFPSSEFAESMAENAKLSNVVKNTIEIGKNLGDAFAWFFFKNNREELQKHFKHKSNGLFVSGIGGKGELEFVKKINYIDGYYVLYHGITNMLRVGDFSLYDLSQGIIGVGELKTVLKDNMLHISASISSKYNIQLTNQNNNSETFEYDINDIQKNFPRIVRQLKEQESLLRKNTSNIRFDLFTSYDYDILNSLSQQNPMVLNSDNSLLLVAEWSKYESLFDILLEDEKCNIYSKDKLLDNVKCLMEPDDPYNMAFVGKLNTTVNILSIPILWWNINDDICRNIYFNKMTIATIFNPAKFIQYFINDNFSVTTAKYLDGFQLNKVVDESKITFGNFGSMCYLIKNNLMKTADAYSGIKQLLNSISSGEVPPNSKVELNIILNSFGKRKPMVDR